MQLDNDEKKHIINECILDLEKIKNYKELDNLKIKYLGRKGLINELFKKIKSIPNSEVKEYGLKLNEIKNEIKNELIKKEKDLTKNESKEQIDITLPGINNITYGSKHLISKTIEEIEYFFINLGFDVLESKEIENCYYNFDALNINKNHPSRNKNETFYLNEKTLLRTHTSNMQIHAMKEKKVPISAISYGKVFRRDSDASHTPMFHQMEGFVIDKNISIANLKFIISNFLNFFFKKNMKINMRSSYFPFTEPSMEVDIQCISCLGKKCSLCKQTGWIEVLGCGMINPKVLKNCNINEKYTGLAFGLGIERLCMIKYKINDIRLFFENNTEFLKQF